MDCFSRCSMLLILLPSELRASKRGRSSFCKATEWFQRRITSIEAAVNPQTTKPNDEDTMIKPRSILVVEVFIVYGFFHLVCQFHSIALLSFSSNLF